MKKINLIVLTILICFIILFFVHELEINTKFEKSKHINTIIFLLLLFYRILKNKNILKTLKKDFNNNEFLIYFIIVISFSTFIILEKNIYKNENIQNMNKRSYKRIF